MPLWPRRTQAGWRVVDDAAEDRDEDALVTKKLFWYRVDGYGGAKIGKSTPLWHCWRCQTFDCPHTAVVVQEDHKRRGVQP